ncbi:MAG: hypothetical protein H7X97_09355 [Opitutaceae bacterium]|nr:hypothetical protein [Verrucomicrobiales bacterium]
MQFSHKEKHHPMKCLILLMIVSLPTLKSQPTEVRQWHASSGHETQARALSATATAVKLELPSGKTFELPLEKLIAADREFILKRFNVVLPKVGDPQRSTDALIQAEGQTWPPGKISGPVESAPGSHYYIYLPKSLRAGRKAPLLHFNGSGGGNPEQMQRYLAGCESFGWILVASVESKNNTTFVVNSRHAANNIAMLRATPLVDARRIYFTGQSGGGAMSWWNALELDGAGTLPSIGYIPFEIKVTKGHHFILHGATDYNRYLGGRAAAQFGKDAFYRMHPGGHNYPKEEYIIREGIGWLTGKYLAANSGNSSLAGERLDYEAAMIDWIRQLSEKDPGLAYHLGEFMVSTYRVSGKNATLLDGIVSKLRQSPGNVVYEEGVQAIHEFGVKEFGSFQYVGSMNGKNHEAHAKTALRLAEKYKGDPFVEETLREMALPAQK